MVSKPNTDVIATGEEFHKQMGSIIDGKHSGITQKLFFPKFLERTVEMRVIFEVSTKKEKSATRMVTG